MEKDINQEVLKSDEEKVEDLTKDAKDLEKAVGKEIKDKVEKVEEINDAKAEPLDAKDGKGKTVKDVVASDKEFKEEQEREDVEFPEVKKSEFVTEKLKPFTEKLELNESEDVSTIRELVTDYLLDKTNDMLDNIAIVLDGKISGYDVSWSCEDAYEPEAVKAQDSIYEFIDAQVDSLFAHVPVEESLRENKLNESNEEDLKKDAESLSDYLNKNKLYCDLENYEMYPMGVKVVTFRVEGDWKHDHWYFNTLVYRWAAENGKEIFKTDEYTVEEDGSDYYTADHKVYITDKETSDKLNSMRGLFAPKEESLVESKKLNENLSPDNSALVFIEELFNVGEDDIESALKDKFNCSDASFISDDEILVTTDKENADKLNLFAESCGAEVEFFDTDDGAELSIKFPNLQVALSTIYACKENEIKIENLKKIYNNIAKFLQNLVGSISESLHESKLDEAIPREVAQALKNSNNQEIRNSGGYRYKIPGMSDFGTDSVEKKDALSRSNVDYEKAEFNKISKEEAFNVFKTEPQNLLLIVKNYGSDKAIWFDENGNRFGRVENVPLDIAPVKRDGSPIRDTKHMTPKQLIACASACYWTNQREVLRDPDLKRERSQNPESKYYSGDSVSNVIKATSPKYRAIYGTDYGWETDVRGAKKPYQYNWPYWLEADYQEKKTELNTWQTKLDSGELSSNDRHYTLRKINELKNNLKELEKDRSKYYNGIKDYKANLRNLTMLKSKDYLKKLLDLRDKVKDSDNELRSAEARLATVKNQGGTWSNSYDRRQVTRYESQIEELKAQIARYQKYIEELNAKLSSQQVSEEDAREIANAEADVNRIKSEIEGSKNELDAVLNRARARHQQNTESLEEANNTKCWVLFFDKNGVNYVGSEGSHALNVTSDNAKRKILSGNYMIPKWAKSFIVISPYQFDKMSYDELEKYNAKYGIKLGESLEEDLKVTIDFASFEPWGGAEDTYNRIKAAGKLDEADAILEELYPEGISEDSLNTILAHEPEWLLNELGIANEEEISMLDLDEE